MLDTIPFDEFITLGQQIAEDGLPNDKRFTGFGFMQVCRNPRAAMKYLKSCGVKKLGQGSSRAAYVLSADDSSEISRAAGPCVLKIATNALKGAAQNKAEAAMLDKYQRKMECFPKLYACDRQNWSYILAELGTPLNKTPAKFKNQWIQPLRDFFSDYLEERDAFPSVDHPVIDEDEFEIKSGDWLPFTVRKIAEVLAGEYANVDDDELVWLQGLARSMAKSQIPIVRGIGAVLKYAERHGSGEVSLGDLDAPDNWAFVRRRGDVMLIPIDWGASKEVMQKYYVKESITLEQLKKIIFDRK